MRPKILIYPNANTIPNLKNNQDRAEGRFQPVNCGKYLKKQLEELSEASSREQSAERGKRRVFLSFNTIQPFILYACIVLIKIYNKPLKKEKRNEIMHVDCLVSNRCFKKNVSSLLYSFKSFSNLTCNLQQLQLMRCQVARWWAMLAFVFS